MGASALSACRGMFVVITPRFFLWRNFLAKQQLLPPAPEDTCELLPGAHFIQWQTALRGSKGCSPLDSSRDQLCNEICSLACPGEEWNEASLQPKPSLTDFPAHHPPQSSPHLASLAPSPKSYLPEKHLHKDPHLKLYLYAIWPNTVNNTVVYYYYII